MHPLTKLLVKSLVSTHPSVYDDMLQINLANTNDILIKYGNLKVYHTVTFAINVISCTVVSNDKCYAPINVKLHPPVN